MATTIRTDEETNQVGNAVVAQLLHSIQTKINGRQKINMTCYIYDDKCKNHELLPNKNDMGKLVPHQESKHRVMKINGAVHSTGLNSLLVTGGSVDLKRSDFLKIHTKEYSKYMEHVCRLNKPTEFDPPSSEVSITNFMSLEAIYAAIASVKGAINIVCSDRPISTKEIKEKYKSEKKTNPIFRSNIPHRVFCNVRPPGHHAHADHGAGFCFMNNVAIGAKYALDTYPDTIKRVLIFDWDLHHGDGTESIFALNPNHPPDIEDPNKTDSVLYISMHRGPDYYPQTGGFESNDVYSNILNIPLKHNTNIAEYMDYFNNLVLPRARSFDPDLVIISAGFDSHRDDLYRELPLDYSDYVYMTQKLIDLATTCADGRIVSVLEGGYSVNVLIRSVLAHIATMIDYDGEQLP